MQPAETARGGGRGPRRSSPRRRPSPRRSSPRRRPSPRPRQQDAPRRRCRRAAEPASAGLSAGPARRPARWQTAVPFVGLTGGMGAGKSTALAALERLGAAVLSSDAVVHELYAGEQLRDAVVERFGPEVAPAGVVDRAAVAERAFARARGPQRGWRDWCGRWSARGWRPGWSEVRAAAARRRGRRWSRCRCCSRRACRGSTTPRSRSSPTSGCAEQRATAARPRAGRRARRAPALPGGEGATRDLRRAQRRHRGGSRAASCRRCLTSWDDERHDRSARWRAARGGRHAASRWWRRRASRQAGARTCRCR